MKKIMPTNESVRQDIAQYVLDNNVTLHALSLRAGIGATGLRLFMQGKNGMCLDTLAKLAPVIYGEKGKR